MDARRWRHVMKKILLATVLAAATAAIALPAGAAPQVVDATLTNTVSMTASPSATVSGWTLSPSATNTTSGGSMTISANSAYTVTVSGDVSAMTEYITSTSAYASSPKTLSAALNIIAARSGGTAPVPGVGATAVTGTSTTLATGTGLGTDTYDITLSQATTIADQALPTGRTYHIALTYTAREN